MYFEYGDKEISYLRKQDKRLGEAIDAIGHIYREVDPDPFASIVHLIVAQQISSAALRTIWGRLVESLGAITYETIGASSAENIKECGISFKKAAYIKNFAEEVISGRLDIEALRIMPDSVLVQKLTALKGIGFWTAEMLMIFCLQRPDVFSYGDLAIHRGLNKLYGMEKISRSEFSEYAKRFSPYGSVASLYLWEIAGGEKE